MKKIFCIVLILLFVLAVGAVVAQVCVISTVQITGWNTKTVTFTNTSTKEEKVKVRVEWTDPVGWREWQQTVPGGRNVTSTSGTPRRTTTTFIPGTVTWTAPGTITGINECP